MKVKRFVKKKFIETDSRLELKEFQDLFSQFIIKSRLSRSLYVSRRVNEFIDLAEVIDVRVKFPMVYEYICKLLVRNDKTEEVYVFELQKDFGHTYSLSLYDYENNHIASGFINRQTFQPIVIKEDELDLLNKDALFESQTEEQLMSFFSVTAEHFVPLCDEYIQKKAFDLINI